MPATSSAAARNSSGVGPQDRSGSGVGVDVTVRAGDGLADGSAPGTSCAEHPAAAVKAAATSTAGRFTCSVFTEHEPDHTSGVQRRIELGLGQSEYRGGVAEARAARGLVYQQPRGQAAQPVVGTDQ